MVMLSQTCAEGGGSTSLGGCWLGIATCIFYQSISFFLRFSQNTSKSTMHYGLNSAICAFFRL
eukprot:99364-Pleurochrysis_carterae.AAC.1